MKSMAKVFMVLALVAVICLPGMAWSAPTDISDWLRVYDPTHKIAYQISVTEGQEDPNQIYYINVQGLVDLSKFGYATTLIEPITGRYSDIFGIDQEIINGQAQYFLAFNSDAETVQAAFGNQGYYYIPEGNGIHDATMYLDPALQAQGYTAQFASVPLPPTVLLMGGGLLGLVGLRWRRKA